jgi:DNA-binding IclR family transcriptional regulator
MMTYTETVSKLLAAMEGQRLTLNQIVKRSGIARHKVIALLARLIRFNIVRWDYDGQQFLFQTV